MAKSWFASSVAASRAVSNAPGSIQLMRPVDKLGQELLRLGMSGIGNLGDVKEGDIFNTVKPALRGKMYSALCKNPNLCVDKVHYCQSEIEDLKNYLEGVRNAFSVDGDESCAEKMKRLVNHDYLVIELLTGPDPTAAKVHIQAEKVGYPEAGIYITVAEDFEQYAENVTVYTVECKRKKVGLEKLEKVLERHSPDYSVAEHNCWEYARATAQRVLEVCLGACVEDCDGGFQERQRLQKEIDNLGASIAGNHLFHNGKRVVRGVKMLWKGIIRENGTDVGDLEQFVETTTSVVPIAESEEGHQNFVNATTAIVDMASAD